MKANELMIGDWVKINDVDYKDPVQVAQITRKSGEFYIGFGYNGDMILCAGERIDPIPLTEKILKTNGFKVVHQCCYTFVKYNDITILRKEDDEEYLWSIIFVEKAIFKYVHELQHALRLCGLNHLADNFKIKAYEE